MLLGFDLYHIPSSSMKPTFLKGDYVIADTWFEKKNLHPGQIIIFDKVNSSDYFVKRIYARSNERLTIPKYSVPKLVENMLFVAGDNANESLDSRHFGPIGNQRVIGVVHSIWLSIDENSTLRLDRLQWLNNR